MLIVIPNKLKLEKLLVIACKVSWVLTAAVCFCFAVFMMISFYFDSSSTKMMGEVALFSNTHALSFEKIGAGPLSLRPSKKKIALPDMSEEVLLLAKNSRPDRKAKEVGFLIGLRSSKEERRMKNGETLFLACDPQVGGSLPVYRFSERKTPLWIRPSFLDTSKVLLEVGLFMPSKESESFLEERAQFVLEESSLQKENSSGEKWLCLLQKAKHWGVDVVLAKQKEKKYSGLHRKFKVEIPGDKSSVFCFLEAGDFLTWNGVSWTPIASESKAEGRPIAQIKSISAREAEILVWNEEGFYPHEIKLQFHGSARIGSLRPDQIPQAVRARTAKQISCRLAKRRYLLKPGDWVLKMARGWKVLKGSKDIEDYLCHRFRGELCVFESLVRDQGKLMMQGYWVDEMRTQTQPFMIPVEGDGAAKRSLRNEKRRGSLKRSEGSVVTYLPYSPRERREDHE